VNQIELGNHCRDIITGAEGYAAARTEYYLSHSVVLLQRIDRDGYVREEWIHEARLEHTDDETKPTLGFGPVMNGHAE
jgi:hypothetical protein